jgi:hypothetical protein
LRTGDRVLDLAGIVPVARLHRQIAFQLLLVEVADLAFDTDVAEVVALSFLDHIGDDEVAAVRGQLGHRRDDTEIGVALGKVEQPQLLLVEGETIGIVGVRRGEDVPPARLARRHLRDEVAVAELFVADDVDLAHARFGAFVDLEDDIDAVLVELDDLRLDPGGVAALSAIELDDAGDVGAGARTREDLARCEPDLGNDLVVLEAAVAFEDDAVDDRILTDLENDVTGLDAA